MTEPPKGDSDNVVSLDPDRKVPWLKSKRGQPSCRHLPVTVCETSRLVECDLCGAILDPITVLLDIAYEERKLYSTDRATEKARTRLLEMGKEEKRIKARLKTARARLKETEKNNEKP